MYAVILVDENGEILHTVFYKHKPNFQDLFFLGKEIATDKEFNHIADDINEVYVKYIPNMDYNEFANGLFGDNNDN